jgi:hypothetical protein
LPEGRGINAIVDDGNGQLGAKHDQLLPHRFRHSDEVIGAAEGVANDQSWKQAFNPSNFG